jgi:hypothetical protein
MRHHLFKPCLVAVAVALPVASAHAQGTGSSMRTTANCQSVITGAQGAMQRDEQRYYQQKNPIDQAIENVQNLCYGQLRQIDSVNVRGFAFSGFLSGILNGQVSRYCNELISQLYRGRAMTDPRQVLPGGMGQIFSGGSFQIPGTTGNVTLPPGVVTIPGQLPGTIPGAFPGGTPGIAPSPAPAPITPPPPPCPAGLPGLFCRINPLP